MGWRIVRQPNGLLARFSDPIDDFTDFNMTEAEALDLCRTLGETEAGARHRVGSGTADLPVLRVCLTGIGVEARPWRHDARYDGLDRWRDCLMTIRAIHGEGTAERTAELLAEAETNEPRSPFAPIRVIPDIPPGKAYCVPPRRPGETDDQFMARIVRIDVDPGA